MRTDVIDAIFETMRIELLAIGLILAAAPVEASSRPVVAVFTLKGEGSGFKNNELDSVSEYVSTQLAASGRFTVVPRSEVKKTLANQKKESYQACYDESCQIEVGKELAAEKVVVGSIRKFGSVCIVNLRLFDLAKSASEQAGTARGACGDDKVLLSVDRAVASLTGVAPTVTAMQLGASGAPRASAPPPAYVPPAASKSNATPTDGAGEKDTLRAAGSALGSNRHRRSFVGKMARVERTVCSAQQDITKAENVVNLTCEKAPGSRACGRAKRRTKRLYDRVDDYLRRRASLLAKAVSDQGADFGRALDQFSLQVRECWCDPARGTRRACRVR